jgi:hypothetical protein
MMASDILILMGSTTISMLKGPNSLSAIFSMASGIQEKFHYKLSSVNEFFKLNWERKT